MSIYVMFYSCFHFCFVSYFPAAGDESSVTDRIDDINVEKYTVAYMKIMVSLGAGGEKFTN